MAGCANITLEADGASFHAVRTITVAHTWRGGHKACCRLAAALVRLDLAKAKGSEDARKLLAGEAVEADEDEEDAAAQEMKDKAGDKPQVRPLWSCWGQCHTIFPGFKSSSWPRSCCVGGRLGELR